jgi:hypothetical protein
LAFITFSVFAVINIVTAVFLDTALSQGNKDRDLVIHEEMDKKSDYVKELIDLFDELGTMEDGTISMEDFERYLEDEQVAAFFTALRLTINDVGSMFKLLDSDASGTVDLSEFVEGCYRLHGESRTLDLVLLQDQVVRLSKSVNILLDRTGPPEAKCLS